MCFTISVHCPVRESYTGMQTRNRDVGNRMRESRSYGSAGAPGG